MQYAGPVKGPPVVAELAKIAQVLRDMKSRQSFVDDPKAALDRAGVNMKAVPSSVVDTLSGMSQDELGAVIRFNDALVEGGLVTEAPEPDGARVSFF
jgi:hypothetical protein